MGWIVKTSAVVGVLAAAGVSAAALAPSATQDQEAQEKDRQVRVLERVVEHGQHLLRFGGPRLGVSLQDVTEATARDRKLQSPGGALVADVEEESPAAKAGVRDGDIIVEFDGERVRSVRQLQRLVNETPAGRPVGLVVWREGRRVDLSASLEQRDASTIMGGIDREKLEEEIRRGVEEGTRGLREFRFYSPEPGVRDRLPRVAPLPRGEFRREPGVDVFQWFGGTGRLGASVQTLTPQLREHFGAPAGVLVSSVNPESPAAQAGIKAGDVIVSAGGTKVSAPGDLARAVRSADEGDELEIGIVRDRKEQTVRVKLGPAAARGAWPI